MAIIQLAHNSVVAKLIDPTKEIVSAVSQLLSYLVEGADHIYSVNSGRWDGRSSFYEMSNNTFPAGFVFLVRAELTRLGHTVHLIRKPHVEPKGEYNPIVDEHGNDNPDYDFQIRSLRQVEKHGRGIIQVATGGGKSKIAKLVIQRYRRMTLFLTTRQVLLNQMDRQLKAMGLNTGQIGIGEERVVAGVNLCMVQTLVQALDVPTIDQEVRAIVKSIHTSKNKDENMPRSEILVLAKKRIAEKQAKCDRFIKILGEFEVVIGEEAHEAGGESYFKILQHCKKATIRVALTATPFMRDSAEDNMRLMAAFGPILIRVSEKLLIDRGILATPIFKYVDALPHPKLRRTSPFARAYQLGYMENDNMHRAALRDALKAKAHGMPTLTLIVRKDHGKTIEELYRAAGLRVRFMQGENDAAERQSALDALAAGEIDVLIGTTILDVGVDVPAICLVQLLGGYKAEVALRQRIGRGLRRKRINYTFIVDYSCNINATLREHTMLRRAIVESTPGFAEGVLKPGQDFDWNLFGKIAA